MPSTRIYIPSTSAAPAISPTQDAAWTHTQNFTRVRGSTSKIASAMTTITHNNATGGAKWVAVQQVIYGPLAAQTISGAHSAQNRGSESGAALDAFNAIGIRVIGSDGTTVRGTLRAVTQFGTEYVVGTLTNRANGNASSLSSVICLNGDYLVIEVGMRQAISTAQTSSISIGDDSASDLPQDGTTTTPDNPWVEFDSTINLFVASSLPLMSPSRDI